MILTIIQDVDSKKKIMNDNLIEQIWYIENRVYNKNIIILHQNWVGPPLLKPSFTSRYRYLWKIY